MTHRKIIYSLVAACAATPFTVFCPGPASAVSGDPNFTTSVLESHHPPAARGRGEREPARRGDRERGQAPTDPTEEEAEDPCPTQRWTIPLEIEGVLCLLVVESPEEQVPAP